MAVISSEEWGGSAAPGDPSGRMHWAAGLMVGIVLGRKIAVHKRAVRKRGVGLHHPLLVAAGACSMVTITAIGLPQSAPLSLPLLAATSGNFLENTLGGLIPSTQTALSPFLLVFVLFELLTIRPGNGSARIATPFRHFLLAFGLVGVRDRGSVHHSGKPGIRYFRDARHHHLQHRGQLANLIQPFQALPFMATCKTHFQDITPCTFTVVLYAITVASVSFLVFPKGL